MIKKTKNKQTGKISTEPQLLRGKKKRERRLPPPPPSTKTACVTLPPLLHTCPVHRTDDVSACVLFACPTCSSAHRAPCSKALRLCISWARERQDRTEMRFCGSDFSPPLSLSLSSSLLPSLPLVHLLWSSLSQWETFASWLPQRDASSCAALMSPHSQRAGPPEALIWERKAHYRP